MIETVSLWKCRESHTDVESFFLKIKAESIDGTSQQLPFEMEEKEGQDEDEILKQL